MSGKHGLFKEDLRCASGKIPGTGAQMQVHGLNFPQEQNKRTPHSPSAHLIRKVSQLVTPSVPRKSSDPKDPEEPHGTPRDPVLSGVIDRPTGVDTL